MSVEYEVSWRSIRKLDDEVVKAFIVLAGGFEYYYLPFRGLLVRYNISEDWWEVAYFNEKVKGEV